jgi:uncharacterized protein
MQVRCSRSAFYRLFLSLALLFSSLPIFAERVEDMPKPTNWVVDDAHVLSPQTIARLESLCGQLSHSKTNAQIEIVTIRTLDGDDIDDFTNRLEEKWKIGKKGSDRGILMLFAIQDRKRRIEVGDGLQGFITDAKAGDIGRSMVPALRQGNYDAAVTTGVSQLANLIADDAKVTLQDAPEPTPQPMPIRRHSGSSIGWIFRIVIIVLILLFLGVRGLFGFGLGMLFGGGRGGWGGGGWGGGGSDGGGFSGGGGDSGGGFDGSGGGGSDGGGASGDW